MQTLIPKLILTLRLTYRNTLNLAPTMTPTYTLTYLHSWFTLGDIPAESILQENILGKLAKDL